MADLQIATGARAAEALAVRHGDVTPDGFVLIRALKGSRTRMGFCPAIVPLVSRSRGDAKLRLFGTLSWSQYYNALLRAGIERHTIGRPRRTVSNLFRRAAAEMAYDISGGDLSVASEFLGHIALKSTLHYLPRKEVTLG